MSAQLNDVVYAERQGIAGKLTVAEIVALPSKWLDYIIANTSINESENTETIFGSAGISTEIIYKGTTLKKHDLNDETQSYILTLTNNILATQK